LNAETEARLREQIEAVAKQVPGLGEATTFHIRPVPDGYDVVLHCLADPDLPIAEAHRLADELEKRLEIGVKGISQVLVHVEPEEKGPAIGSIP
jgi:divalent metal cation (Fe/Co/Zn/Cd) transporter